MLDVNLFNCIWGTTLIALVFIFFGICPLWGMVSPVISQTPRQTSIPSNVMLTNHFLIGGRMLLFLMLCVTYVVANPLIYQMLGGNTCFPNQFVCSGPLSWVPPQNVHPGWKIRGTCNAHLALFHAMVSKTRFWPVENPYFFWHP